MRRNFLIIALMFISAVVFAQKETSLNIGGFVRADAIYDTRQNVEAREGYLALYPLKPNVDANGVDINDNGSFSQYAMISRLRVDYRGIDILKAKTKAYIEMDFSGASNANSNTLRLRHAYIEMQWTNVKILLGQYWHPLTVPEVFPRMLSLNTGAPFHAFNRSPQMRLDWQTDFGKFVFVTSSQRDFMSPGYESPSVDYLRNSGLPNLHFQYHVKYNKIYAGVGADWKKIVPRIKTDNNVAVDESISSLSLIAFAKADFNKFSVRVEGVYGENLFDHLMLGGYAVSEYDIDSLQKKYSNIAHHSVWGDVQYKFHPQWNAGVFAGYTINLGASDKIADEIYSRGNDIDYIYRVAPRVSWKWENISVIAECEITTAAYGDLDCFGKITNSKEVTNVRSTLSVCYNF
ncbi:MAG: hypothetical protein U9R32_04655 [Bacteroidota bacterium]|nr:hypothetical protein [Bacteroidota bacterium]